MKIFFVAFALLAIPTFSRYQRPLQLSGTGQHYFVVDDTLWNHARQDLADLRLYAGQTELAYALVTERGSERQQDTPVPVLQQATVAGKTQFLIDMSSLAEYDHVNLSLAAKNFIVHARVEGSEDPHAKQWAALADNILYDFSSENLGGNSMLRLPRATYRYLRVTMDGPVKPKDILGATSERAEAQPALWRDVSNSPTPEQNGKDTVLSFAVTGKVPIERVLFALDATQPNFRRDVEIQDEKGAWIGSGEISRIHMVRNGQKIDSEDRDIAFSANGAKTIKVVIHNGDDPPLKLTGASLQQLERRIYFDAPASGAVTLYYGDDKLQAPVYDYAKLFLQDKAAVAAQPGDEAPNSAYADRPDDRPWSERHPAVLWVAIVAAVLILGAVALRSMQGAA